MAVGQRPVDMSSKSTILITERRHAFSDLMAYSCTFEFCDHGPFGSLTAWATHEKTEHLRDWHCPICNDSYGSRSLLMAHISKSHPSSEETLSYGQVNDVSPPIETATASQCPFCDQPELTDMLSPPPTPRRSSSNGKTSQIDWYQQHLSHHMEQLALLAKSAYVGDDRVDDDSNAEASSQAASSDTTERSHDSEIVNLTTSERSKFDLPAADIAAGIASDSGTSVTVQTPFPETVGYRAESRDAADTADYEHASGPSISLKAQTFQEDDPFKTVLDLGPFLSAISTKANNLDADDWDGYDEYDAYGVQQGPSYVQQQPQQLQRQFQRHSSFDRGASGIEKQKGYSDCGTVGTPRGEIKEEENQVIEEIYHEKRETNEREQREGVDFERRRKKKEHRDTQAKLEEAIRKGLAATALTPSEIDSLMIQKTVHEAYGHQESTASLWQAVEQQGNVVGDVELEKISHVVRERVSMLLVDQKKNNDFRQGEIDSL
jgi:hypothetical protein